MRYNLSNIYSKSIEDNPVKRSKVINKSGIHLLLKDVKVTLSNGKEINIPKGFEWDLASVPQIVQSIIRDDGDDDIAYLIHDFLYVNKLTTRVFADKEMLKWSKAMRQTDKISIRNIDINIRYHVVRWFGGFVW